MSVRVASLMLAVALAPLGCAGGQIRASIGTYEAGNYNRAAHHCSEVADVEDDLNEKAHVRYLVYCGLTSYRLGHRAEAQRLLTLGSQEYQQGSSRWLKPAIVDEMMKALDDLEGRSPPVPQSSTTIVSGGPGDEEVADTPEDPERL